MNIVASIQARMGSKRLPGKVLENVCGKPMLLWQVERMRRSRVIDNVVVATSLSSIDDELESFCRKHQIDCYRGSEEDVLSRITALTTDLQVDIHVESFGDSPLIDPQIIDEFIAYYLKYKDIGDYFSSALKTTYPPGMEVSIYRSKTLLDVNRLVLPDDPLREHAGFNITRFPERFKLHSIVAPAWHFAPDVFLEVDVSEDLEVLREIVNYFVSRGEEYFSLREILSMLESRPELAKKNRNIERRWKILRDEVISKRSL